MTRAAAAKKTEPVTPDVDDKQLETIPEGGEVATLEDDEDITGYEDFDPSEFIVPRVKIVQPTSKEGTAGTFLVNLTGEEFDALEVVVLKVMRTRVLWAPPEADRKEPLCRSYDFMTPDCAELDTEPVSEICMRHIQKGRRQVPEVICPKAQWIDNKRPECDEVYNLLCVTTDGIPFWLNAAGASIKPTRAFISAISLRRKKLSDFATALTLDPRTEPHKHFVLKYAPPRAMTPEHDAELLEMVADMKSALKDQSVQRSEEAEAAAEADADNAGWASEDSE